MQGDRGVREAELSDSAPLLLIMRGTGLACQVTIAFLLLAVSRVEGLGAGRKPHQITALTGGLAKYVQHVPYSMVL